MSGLYQIAMPEFRQLIWRCGKLRDGDFIMFHGGCMPQDFVFPKLAFNLDWRLFIDTSAESPHDIYPEMDGSAPAAGGRVTLHDRSLVCYVAV